MHHLSHGSSDPKKSGMRRVVIKKYEDNQNFAIDEDDYFVVQKLITSVNGAFEYEDDMNSDIYEAARSIGDDEDRRVLSLQAPYCTRPFTVPKEIANLDNLTDFCLFGAAITTLPDEIGDLSGLENLRLEGTHITSLPSSIGRLKKLECLHLEKTINLLSLPDEIGDLSSLKRLYLDGSRITSLPSSIGRLEKLECLWLEKTTNLLSLPDEIGKLISLKTLLLRGSSIKSMPEDAGSLNSLETLALSNLFIASLSNWIGSLSGHIHLIVGSYISKLQENDFDKILLQLVKDCQSLVCISKKVVGESQFNASIPVGHSLACNRARSRSRFGAHAKVSPKLWPLLLRHATRPFRNFNHDAPYYEKLASIAEYEITNHDAIYQLLVDGRGPFIGILLGRNKGNFNKNSR